MKKLFLKISHNSQKKSFTKMKEKSATLLKKRLRHKFFEIFKNTLLQNTSVRLLPLGEHWPCMDLESSGMVQFYLFILRYS